MSFEKGAAIALLLALGAPVQALAARSSFHAAVGYSAPLLHYRFDEVSGPAVNHGSLGAAFDGTYFGTPVQGIPTPGLDAGVGFDGSNDYIASLSAAPAQLTGNPTFTIEAIVQIPQGATATLWPPFLHWGSANPQTGRSVWFGLQNSNEDVVYAGFYNSGLRAVNPFTLGSWHHVVWVRVGGAHHSLEGSTLYVDGVAVATTQDTSLPAGGPAVVPDVTSTDFRINRGHDLTRYFQGIMDELALYDRALSSWEVEGHYAASGLQPTAIPGLYDTGVDDQAVPLPGGAVDPHYSLISSADPVYPGPGAIVASVIPAAYWTPNGSSKWIAPAAGA